MSILTSHSQFQRILDPGLRVLFGANYEKEGELVKAMTEVAGVAPSVLCDLWLIKYGHRFVSELDMYFEDLFYIAAAKRLSSEGHPLFISERNGYCMCKDPDGNN